VCGQVDHQRFEKPFHASRGEGCAHLQGSIYLQERDRTRLLNPGMLDYPFEKYMQYNDEIDETVRRSISQECGSNALPLQFLLKYIFENETTKRLVFCMSPILPMR